MQKYKLKTDIFNIIINKLIAGAIAQCSLGEGSRKTNERILFLVVHSNSSTHQLGQSASQFYDFSFCKMSTLSILYIIYNEYHIFFRQFPLLVVTDCSLRSCLKLLGIMIVSIQVCTKYIHYRSKVYLTTYKL